MGRTPIASELLFFSAGLKAYAGVTDRKAVDQVKLVVGKQFWDENGFHFNRFSEYLNRRQTTHYLNWAIAEVCSPFAAFADEIVLDGTGISLTARGTYRSEHYPSSITAERLYARLNLAMDLKLKIFPAAIVTADRGKGTGELTQAPELLRRLKANGWHAKRVLADGLYGTEDFFKAVIEDYGAWPVVPLKRIYSNTRLPKTELMRKLFLHFLADRDAFYEEYRKRPLVESGISALKRRFTDEVRSRNARSVMNEILFNVLCYDIDCLVHACAIFGLDIERIFTTTSDGGSQIVLP